MCTFLKYINFQTLYLNVAVFDVDDNKNLIDSTCALKPPSKPRPPVGRTQAAVARKAVGHWLMITSIDVLLNAPDIAVRFLALVGLLCEDSVIQWNPLESNLTFSSEYFYSRIMSDECRTALLN
jgi:hypothetical protein